MQTDQSFEGEEMFNISFSLEEHVFYAFKPFDFYKDSTNYTTISGCPLVTFNEERKEVNLIFGEGDCITNQPERKGKLILTYIDSLFNQEKLVRIGYEEYSARGIQLEGHRFINQIDSSFAHGTFRDELINFIIRDDNNSTSKVNAVFNREVIFSTDSIQNITTTGSSSGRNLAGRSFGMEITQPKHLDGACIRNGSFVPKAGQEIWTFERTVEPDVVHIIHYEEDPDCNNSATIQLDDGREMVLTQ